MRATACFLLIAGAALPGTAQDSGTRAEDFPTVRPVFGDLRLWRAGTKKTEALRDATTIPPDDRLGTAKGASGGFCAPGDTLVTLKGVEAGPDKGLSVERVDKRLTFRLHEGRMVVESFETEVSVETAHGKVTGRNACLLIESKGQATRVAVLDGQVTFINSLGEVKLEGGQETRAEKGKAPEEPRPTVADPLGDRDSPPNLVQNPGFEAGGDRWELHSSTRPDATTPHSGRQCLRIPVSNALFGAPPPGGNVVMIGLGQPVRCTAGRRYLFRAYVRTETRQGGVRISFRCDSTTDIPSPMKSEGAWKMKRAILKPTVKDGRLEPMIFVDAADYDATIWLDDVYLCELPAETPVKPKR